MSELETRLRQRATALLEQWGQPGAAVALTLDGQPVFSAVFGQSDDLKNATDARFPVYSITKTLIAAAALHLVQEGALGLDAALGSYLPELPYPLPMTVRQTLNHTGGLPDYGHLTAYQNDLKANPQRPWSQTEFLERTVSGGLFFRPDSGFSYSNTGYLLLRLLLERLTGQTLKGLLHDSLFAPLGLTRTAVVTDLNETQSLTPGFSRLWADGGAEADVRPLYHPGWVAHGLVASTAPELARLIDAVFTGVFFGPDLLRQMLSPVPVAAEHPVFRRPAYGLGMMLGDSDLGQLVGHGGGGPGYSAGTLHSSAERLTCAALVDWDIPEAGLILAHELGLSFKSPESRPERP